MGKYLVTGAAGFIGAAIAEKLLSQGHKVWTIDNLSTGYNENIPDGVIFIQGACQDELSISKLNGLRFDAILHFAGQSSGEVSFDDPVYDLRTNTESTLRLIKYGLESSCKRFIYASSMSIYGTVDDEPIAESHETLPLSFYGVGKLASENYLRIYASKGLKFTALRFFNVYGPGQNMKNLRQGMVSIFLKQLLEHDKIMVKGPLDRFRDFVYIEDCVNFTTGIIENKNTFGRFYNVGTGVRTTVKKLLDQMIKISGIEKQIIIETGTPGDQKGIYADTCAALSDVGFKARFSLEEGLEQMILWAKNISQ